MILLNSCGEGCSNYICGSNDDYRVCDSTVLNQELSGRSGIYFYFNLYDRGCLNRMSFLSDYFTFKLW